LLCFLACLCFCPSFKTIIVQYKLGKHRSNALELVHRIPVVEVDGDMAICDGGGGGLGHPLEYIALDVPNSINYCKYCSLRYTKSKNSKSSAH
jgi:NADH dehydrogenase (ubiquinone) Fe-S protein 6